MLEANVGINGDLPFSLQSAVPVCMIESCNTSTSLATQVKEFLRSDHPARTGIDSTNQS